MKQELGQGPNFIGNTRYGTFFVGNSTKYFKTDMRFALETMSNNSRNNTERRLLLDLLTKSLKTVTAGKINIDIEGKPAIKIDIDKQKEKINLDFIHPAIIETETGSEDRPGLFDKLKTAKEFAQKLTDNGLTLSFFRKGKEAIVLGKEAHPRFSRLITRSDDIQIDSIRESAKLSREL